MRGHVCQQLFYLVNDDYIDDEIPVEVAAAAALSEDGPDQKGDPVAAATDPPPQVSLYALAGIRTNNAMLLLVTVCGQWLIALPCRD